MQDPKNLLENWGKIVKKLPQVYQQQAAQQAQTTYNYWRSGGLVKELKEQPKTTSYQQLKEEITEWLKDDS